MKILKFFAIALVAWIETAQAEDVTAQPPDQMILIPAGTFTDGLTSSNEATFIRECMKSKYKKNTCKEKLSELKKSIYPKENSSVDVNSFYIDIYEVTVAEYIKCVRAGVCSSPDFKAFSCPVNSTYLMYVIDPVYADHPINCVSASDAQRYCEWQGKRLPTAIEWRKAARGPSDDRFFPWGDTSPSCDHIAAGLDFKEECHWFPGGDFASCQKLDPSHPCHRTRREFESIWPIYSKPQGVSPYGVFHMAGNVREWVTDADVDSGHSFYRIQGSSFGNERINLGLLSGSGPIPVEDDGGSDMIGFRCSRSAE